MAQAALDEEFYRIARLVWTRSTELTDLEVMRWMKSIDQLESNRVISEGVAYDLRSCGFFWRRRFDDALKASRLALQRLQRDTAERAHALTNLAAAALAAGDSKAAIDASIEALDNSYAFKPHVAGVLVGALFDLGLTEQAADVADEYLSDASLEDGSTSINAAFGLALLGRHHRAVEHLARHVASVMDEPRGDRTALEVLAAHRSRATSMIAHMPELADAWRYAEAYDAAKRALEHDEPCENASERAIPAWVHALRARAASAVLPEGDA